MGSSDPYSFISRFYDPLIEPLQAGVRRVALDILPPDESWRVLDVGCGTGTGLAPYQALGCSITGVDTSPSMIEKAVARLGSQADLHLTDGGALPFDDDTFDLVMTSYVLHEIPAAERVGFVAEMKRVAKPTGSLMIVDFRFGSLRGWKGPVFYGIDWFIELFSGHYPGYRSFKKAGGVPPVLEEAGLPLGREKILSGGSMGVYLAHE